MKSELKSFFIISAIFCFFACQNANAQSPQIIQQPNNLLKCIGNSGQVIIQVTGTMPMTYVWHKGATIVGTNSNVLDFPSLSLSDDGEYYCEISNADGSIPSSSFNVTVVATAPVITNITTENNLVCLTTNNLLEVLLTGENVTKTWYHNSVFCGYGMDYLISDASLTDEGDYYCQATNACGSDVSDIISIDVVIPASIITEPTTQTVCEGEDVTFTPEVTGDYLNYLWLKDEGFMTGETSVSLTIENLTYPHSFFYKLVAYNVCEYDTSNAVTINVNNLPQITGQPIDQSECLGEFATLYAYAGGTTEVDYQWFNENGIITDSILSSIIIDFQTTDTLHYYCEISNICGTVSTSSAEIIPKTPPTITQQPVGTTVCEGQNVSILVKARGTEPLFYQWLYNGADVYGTNITGDETSTLSITSITTGQFGLYSCHVSNECGFVVSEEVEIIVNTSPIISEQPENVVICEGLSLDIPISSQGTDPIDYEWFIEETGQSIGTDMIYTTDYANPENSGSYYCIASNSCGEISTDTIAVQILALVQITVQPVGDAVCVDEYVEMSVEATGATPLDFLWYRNGSPVSSETNNVISYDAAQVNQTGSYFCRVSNYCGYEDSYAAELSIGTPPAITWNPIDQSLCEIEPLTLIMDAQGDNYELQWFFNESPIANQNDTALNIAMLHQSDQGYYYCSAFNACATVYTDTVYVQVDAAPVVDLGPDLNFCSGESTILTPGQEYNHYDWNNGLSYQPTLEVLTSGDYILEVIGDNSCLNRDTINVTFHPYHEILFGNENIIVCGTYILDAGEGAYSYLWSTEIANVSSITITEPGTYSVTTTGDSFGCESTATINIEVRVPISFSLGEDLSAPVSSFVDIGIEPIFSEYHWNTGFTGPMLTVYGSSFGLGTHQFWLTAVALNGCNYTDTIEVTFWNDSHVNQEDINDLVNVYPNPATDKLVVESEMDQIQQVKLFGLTGNCISENNVINSNTFTLDLQYFSRGVYYIQILTTENKIISRKVVIQ